MKVITVTLCAYWVFLDQDKVYLVVSLFRVFVSFCCIMPSIIYPLPVFLITSDGRLENVSFSWGPGHRNKSCYFEQLMCVS